MADLTSALTAGVRRSIRANAPVYLVPTYGRGWQQASVDEAKFSTAGYIVIRGNIGTEYDGAGRVVRTAPVIREGRAS